MKWRERENSSCSSVAAAVISGRKRLFTCWACVEMSERVIGKAMPRTLWWTFSRCWCIIWEAPQRNKTLLILSVISCGALDRGGLRTGWHEVRPSIWVLAFSSPVKYCLGPLLDPIAVKSHVSCVSTEAAIHSFYHTTHLCQYLIIHISRKVMHFTQHSMRHQDQEIHAQGRIVFSSVVNPCSSSFPSPLSSLSISFLISMC